MPLQTLFFLNNHISTTIILKLLNRFFKRLYSIPFHGSHQLYLSDVGSKEDQKVNKMYPRSGKGVGADPASGVESGIQLVIRIIVFSGCGPDKMLSL